MKLALLLLIPSIAAANPLRHEDVEAVRTDLISLTAVSYTAAGVEEAREVRTYDATGHVTRQEHRKPDGSVLVSIDYTWDTAGRQTSHTYRDNTKRVERRDYTYKLDTQGRVIEHVMRDPSKPVGEYYRYEHIHDPDGSQRIQSYRHYPTEGPYRSDSEVIDPQGRTRRRCREHGGCEMNEYDAHGVLTRVRQQTKDEHHYLTFDTTYTAGRIATRTIGNIINTYAWNARGDVSEIKKSIVASQGGAAAGKTIFTYQYRR